MRLKPFDIIKSDNSVDFTDCIKIGKETYHVLGFSRDSMQYETLEETTYKTIKELRGLYETLSF